MVEHGRLALKLQFEEPDRDVWQVTEHPLLWYLLIRSFNRFFLVRLA
jgi:hypothetical protein